MATVGSGVMEGNEFQPVFCLDTIAGSAGFNLNCGETPFDCLESCVTRIAMQAREMGMRTTAGVPTVVWCGIQGKGKRRTNRLSANDPYLVLSSHAVQVPN